LLRKYWIEIGWGVFAVTNLGAMVLLPSWETIPFHFIWISLTLVYGFRVWSIRSTGFVLGAVALATGLSIFSDAFDGLQLWGELFEVPLMAAMFLAMVWHARRRQDAMREAQALAESRATLLTQQERFLHDASHELRTPLTIARGHLDLVRREGETHELSVALDELARMERVIERLLLLATAERPDFLSLETFELEPFLEEVFMRWADVTPRGWRLGHVPDGDLTADREALRTALDALIENAVKFTEPHESIELRARIDGGELALEVADAGSGVPPEALERIFERFGRADDARTRTRGGAGLGLAIVDTIARAHNGRCTATVQARGTVFALCLPRFRPRERLYSRPDALSVRSEATL
jgi:signal transduction histidine kinase